jgi:hypothetical protein
MIKEKLQHSFQVITIIVRRIEQKDNLGHDDGHIELTADATLAL